jgi:hypothetical protein
MREAILIAVLSTAVIGVIGWVATVVKRRLNETIAKQRVYAWLQLNTRDEPGESHVDTITLAKGARLTEEQIHKACMSDKRIYRSIETPELWSCWRQEPQSIYEKRGLLVL